MNKVEYYTHCHMFDMIVVFIVCAAFAGSKVVEIMLCACERWCVTCDV